MLIIDGCRGSAFPTNLPDSITIGWEADQYAYDIPLDISQEMARWPGSVPVLIYSRPGEKNTVQPAVTTLSGTTLFWSPDAYATAIHGGSGLAQIVFTTAGDPVIVGHSKVIKLAIFASLEASDDPPEPYETWIQSLLDAAAEAVDAAEAAIAAAEMIKTITASATTLPAGSQATASYDDGRLYLGIPKGDKGDTGETGATPNLTIGTVTTLPPGSDATAEITGTPEDPVLRLGIPEGDQGERGPIGQTPNLTIGTVTTLPTGSDATAEITGTPEEPVLNLGLPRGEPGEVTEAQLQAVIDSKADVIIDSGTPGTMVTIPDGANNAPIKSIQVEIVAQQAGIGDPSPSNIRPISGFNSVTIYKGGYNLFDKTKTFDGYYIASDGLRKSISAGFVSDYIPIAPNTTYRISQWFGSNVSRYFAFYETQSTSTFISSVIPTYTGGTFTTPANAHYMRLSGSSAYIDTMMLTVGDAEQGNYVPYNATAIPINFPTAGTVYGGTLVINEDGSGVLSVNGVRIVADGTNVAVTGKYTQGNAFLITVSKPVINKVIYADRLKTFESYSSVLGNYGIAMRRLSATSNTAYIYMSNNEVSTTVEEFNTWLQSNNVEIVYFLDTPITYNLTASQITTLLGINNIWADTGDINAIEYRADTKRYIDKKIAAALAGS